MQGKVEDILKAISPENVQELRKFPVQPVDRTSAFIHITVQGTEAVVGTATTAEFPPRQGTPSVRNRNMDLVQCSRKSRKMVPSVQFDSHQRP